MPRTLLLADDSITIQKVVAITFAAEDFTVVTVDNGEDAFARARELQPAIILADVAMPRRNGYELSHAIKSDPQLQRIPVLLLSGTFEPLDPAKAGAALADGHLVKPFDSQVLIDKVNELLGAAPAVQAPVALPAPAPAAARPAAPQQAFPQGAPRPPSPVAPAGFPQRPVPLTQQPGARPPTSPFGIPAAPQAMPPPQAIPVAPRPAAAAAPPPRAPLPLTSPFQSAPSAVPARPQPMAAAPQPTSPFSPPQVFTPQPAASPFPPATAPRAAPQAPQAPHAPTAPSPFARPATGQVPIQPPAAAQTPAVPARPVSPFPPIQPPAPSPTPSPATNLWGAPPAVPAARPAAPLPLPAAPMPRAPAAAALPAAAPPAAAPMGRPASIPVRPGSLTPTWGEQDLRASAFPTQPAPAPSAPASQFSQDMSAEISGMAEAAAAASVQPSPADLSLDVRMDEEPPELLPEIDGFELGGSQDLDVSLTGGGSSFVSGALSDFSQQGGTTPTDGITFDDGGAFDQPIELASPHEFLGGASQPPPAAQAPAPAAAAQAAPAASQAPPDGEAALRLALSQASREVIERVVWEVVPQLAEIILREHVERMEMERTQA